ncbi:uncharacterized protein J3D65DRAFT_463300 [Phyllosticta citribraziliensis]|uniref:Uncharacterized protein n=1 Tax=Phyllosticta citribraziliensis TaxID=989973 RepID=A0ABR1LFE7_9PEZI
MTRGGFGMCSAHICYHSPFLLPALCGCGIYTAFCGRMWETALDGRVQLSTGLACTTSPTTTTTATTAGTTRQSQQPRRQPGRQAGKKESLKTIHIPLLTPHHHTPPALSCVLRSQLWNHTTVFALSDSSKNGLALLFGNGLGDYAGGRAAQSMGLADSLPNTIHTEEVVVISISQLSALRCNRTCALRVSCSHVSACILTRMTGGTSLIPSPSNKPFCLPHPTPLPSPPLTLSTANSQATSWRGAHQPGMYVCSSGGGGATAAQHPSRQTDSITQHANKLIEGNPALWLTSNYIRKTNKRVSKPAPSPIRFHPFGFRSFWELMRRVGGRAGDPWRGEVRRDPGPAGERDDRADEWMDGLMGWWVDGLMALR